MKQEISADSRGRDACAAGAHQEEREMPPGAQRNEALKKRAFSVEMRTIRV